MFDQREIFTHLTILYQANIDQIPKLSRSYIEYIPAVESFVNRKSLHVMVPEIIKKWVDLMRCIDEDISLNLKSNFEEKKEELKKIKEEYVNEDCFNYRINFIEMVLKLLYEDCSDIDFVR